jgi:HlyD family secretion protein
MVKKILFIGVPVVVVVAAVSFFAINGTAKKEDILQTVTAERGSIIDKALAVGQIEPRREIAVKSKVAGIVRTTFAEVGDIVNAGDPLFDVKPDPTPVEFANAKREVELQQVAFDQAKREFDRAKQLQEKKLISHQEFENMQSAYEQAELRLKLSTEKLALIESGSAEVADRTIDNIIKSPISGTVLSLNVEVGDPVVPLTSYQAGTELMTLARMDDLIFKGTVDEIDVGKLSEDMVVEIEIGALPGEDITGQLDRISPKARSQEGARVFDVEIKFEDLGHSFLRAGYSANADIIINKREDVIMIPERLVTMTDSTSTVEVQDTAGVVTTVAVVTGLSDGINIEITEGLAEGDLIVERPPREINPWD